MELTHLDRVVNEALRPVIGALHLLRREIMETMHIPDAPWKILNKSYDELTEEEIFALFDIYHTPGESEPCPMCSWTTRMELQRARKEKEELGG